tara:strand:+ start:292 stop:1158 length:867 start_codon:yes stop_codon:yes gene_type:complete
MRIVITGGSGFLGSHIADELSKKGHKVIIFDKKKSKWIKSNQEMVIGNILDKKKLESVIKRSDIIYHLAGLTNLDEAIKEPIKSVNLNILGTVNVLDLSYKYKIRRFVHASTIYVNSSEGGFYRSSKKAAEDYVMEYSKFFGLKYTILRFGSLYGSRSDNSNGVKRILNDAIYKNKLTYSGNKNSVRKYINVFDAAKACASILKIKYINKHIILTGKNKIKVTSFLKILSKMLKIKKKVEFKEKIHIGHYVVTPYTYVPTKGESFLFKSNINFYDGISKLIKEIKDSK